MLSRAEERRVRALARRRPRDDDRSFLVEGVRGVEEAMDAGLALELAVTAPGLDATERGRRLAERLEGTGLHRRVSDAELDRLAPTQTPQGVLVVARIPTADLAEPDPAAAGGPATVLILDGVQDPGNVGTLARSAAALGARLLICLPGTVDPWNPKSVRASAGGLFRVPVVRTEPARLWEWLDRHRFTLLGADAAGEPVRRRPASDRVALVVGNEGAGLSAATRARCHALVAVPMAGGAESLNVATAAAILLYEINRGTE